MLLQSLFVITASVAVAVKGRPDSLPFCPPSEDIYPCHCTTDAYLRLNLDCSWVSSEQQLSDILNYDFPSTEFYSLHILSNQQISTLADGVFGKLTFVEINIYQGVLQEVQPRALLGSAATLKKLQLKGNRLKDFPFDEIKSYNHLEVLYVSHNEFDAFPRIVSATLKELDLARNPVGNLPADGMKNLPAIETVYLYSCNISEVHTGTFTGLQNLSYLTLAGNLLTKLSSQSFELHGSNARIFFTINNISSVANDSMTGVSYFVNISENNLIYLEEGVWKPILETGAALSVESNPLACGCDIAWLVRNPSLLELIYGNSKCSDGTPIAELDPLVFEIC